MKLKDIFPRWALREPQRDGELDWPGGGSSFAHLTEVVGPTSHVNLDGAYLRQRDETDPDHVVGVDLGRAGVGAVVTYRSVADLGESVFASFDLENGNAPYLDILGDGSLHWGDGTAAPDTTLERLDGATLALTGGGQAPDLVIGGSSADVESYWNGDGTGVVTDFGSANIYLQQSDAEQVVFGVHVSGEAQNRYHQKSDGSLHWGDGVNPPDKSLLRTSDGLIVRHDAGKPFFVTDDAALSGSYAALYGDTGSLELSDDAGHTVALAAASVAGFVRNPTHGGGVQLLSPDGTAYNITVANDGTVTSVAA